MTDRLQGGYKKKLAQLEAEDDPKPTTSKLASLLIGLWSWGDISTPLVQALAEAARQDGLQHEQVEKLAKLGARGKYPGNMQRDILGICGEFAVLTKASSVVPIRLKHCKMEGQSQVNHLTFLLPHKLFACLFEVAPSSFEASVLGGKSANINKFWAAMHNNPKLTSRPELHSRADLHKVVPIALHGDGVNYMQVKRAGGKSLDVLSWSSLLTRAPTKVSSFLMFAVVKQLVKDTGFGQTWPQVWRVLCWSLQCLSTGVWPMVDWEGKAFEEDTIDFQKKGQPLAGGYAAIVFVLRADLEYLSNHFRLNSPSSNSPCALCKADRNMQSVPWTDCRAGARWRDTCWTREDWAAQHMDSHPFFRMPGSGIDLVFPDLMHTKHLGTDQLLLGSTLTWIIRHFLKGTVSQNLEMLWSYIQTWYKELSC